MDENKIDLIEFLLKDWSHPSHFKRILGSVNFFVNSGEQFFKLKVDGEIVSCSEESELNYSQEEADTKVFLCCKHAATQWFSGAAIITVDIAIAI